MPWETLPGGGHIAAVSVSSPDAAGVRLGLVIDSLPVEAILRFYAQADKKIIDETSGREVLAILKRNIDSGDLSEDARTYWTPKTVGTEASIEIELPPGVATQSVRISIPRLTHLFILPQELEQRQMERAAAYCNLDVSCYGTPWSDIKTSVARMSFVEAGSSYTCTGTLLNDRAGSNTPYFLSADHCISDQTTASTLETRWLYHSSSCNGSSANPGATTLAGGSTLLYNTSTTDTVFLKLNRAAPSGVRFAGWWPGLPALSTDMVGIHHPTGDKQKISFGYLADYASCTSSGDGSFSCRSASSSTANHLKLTWRQGITEPGSSGSGVWAAHSDGNYYLVGQLHGGSSSCSATGASDYYGRFDHAYNAALNQWLDTATVTYALSVSISGSGTVTSNPVGINCGFDCTENYNSGTSVILTAIPASGYSFSGWSGACSGTSTTCTVPMTAAKSVTASFTQRINTLTVSIFGSGTVTSNPAGINCGFDCTENYNSGTSVTLTATPASGYTFSGWSGACSGTSTTCTVPMTAAKSVTASFTQVTNTLNVSISGSGTVTSNPAGINCGTDCTENYTSGTSVILTATPASGYTFSGWSGACSGTSTTCTVPMTAAKSVTASFGVATPSDNFTPTSDFTDNADGTVTHKLTGLTWRRCAMGQTWSGSTCSGTATAHTFDQAKALTSTFAGKSDWRLPTPWELATIVDYDINTPVINSTIFPNTPSSYFWSGSPGTGNPSFAWYVNFSNGNAGYGSRSGGYSVRLVRGGQSSSALTTPSSDFTDNRDGTATHNKTGLSWKRCSEGQTWTGATCSSTPSAYTYDQAMALTATFAGKADWRVPNIQELLSIVEYGAYDPALNNAIFPAPPSSCFWSGSPFASNSSHVWYMCDGSATDYSRSGYHHVRLVRGVQSSALLPLPTNGSCGTSDGTSVSIRPTANLCALGVASSVSGNGPWTWTCAGSNGGVSASCTANTSINPSDCLLNWTEDNYPTLFAPSRPTSQTFGGYILRTYSQTGAYLALSSDPNGRIYYYKPSTGSNALLDLGLISTWKTQAGCAQ